MVINGFLSVLISLLFLSIVVTGLPSITEFELEKNGLCGKVKCDFNPDRDLSTLQICRRHGYPVETHIIQSEDGYLLEIHRITGSKLGKPGKQPIILQHGVLSSSTDWVEEGNNSLGFILADAGYDVWIANARGNVYSTGHVSLSTQSDQYWNFSFHEMGLYDMPAILTFIANKTAQPGEILYVGHSMGTTMFFIMASLKPQIAKLVKFMVGLAPIAYMANVRSSLRYLAPFTDNLEWVLKNVGVSQFTPTNTLMTILTYDCFRVKISRIFCENVLFAIAGFDNMETNEGTLPVILAHLPAGSSTKVFLHYSYIIRDHGNFIMYDYGPSGNYIQYGSKQPPSYNLSNIRVPTYLMNGLNDLFGAPTDVVRLANDLPQNTGVYTIPDKKWSHLDFVYAKDAPRLVYTPLLKELRKYRTRKPKTKV